MVARNFFSMAATSTPLATDSVGSAVRCSASLMETRHDEQYVSVVSESCMVGDLKDLLLKRYKYVWSTRDRECESADDLHYMQNPTRHSRINRIPIHMPSPCLSSTCMPCPRWEEGLACHSTLILVLLINKGLLLNFEFIAILKSFKS